MITIDNYLELFSKNALLFPDILSSCLENNYRQNILWEIVRLSTLSELSLPNDISLLVANLSVAVTLMTKMRKDEFSDAEKATAQKLLNSVHDMQLYCKAAKA